MGKEIVEEMKRREENVVRCKLMERKKCKHSYLYEHAVYSQDNFLTWIHRQCSLCGIHHVASTKSWHKPSKNWDLPNLIK